MDYFTVVLATRTMFLPCHSQFAFCFLQFSSRFFKALYHPQRFDYHLSHQARWRSNVQNCSTPFSSVNFKHHHKLNILQVVILLTMWPLPEIKKKLYSAFWQRNKILNQQNLLSAYDIKIHFNNNSSKVVFPSLRLLTSARVASYKPWNILVVNASNWPEIN